MAKNIFIVSAWVVDKNGTFNFISSDYPKTYKSANYGGDVDKAKKRAEGDASEVWGAMCKIDERQVQTVMMTDVFGNVYYMKSMGGFPEEE